LPREEVIRRVVRATEKFPSLLPIVQRGLVLVEDPTATVGQIERVLCADAVMVARILKLANSAYYGVMTEVRTVSMAVNVIGYRRLRSLLRHILAAGLIEILAQGRPGSARIREEAVAVSAASHELALRCQAEDPEELLVAGLLYNIGELALSWSFPKEYAVVIDWSASMPLSSAQEVMFGVSSRQIGRLVLESWRFPGLFCKIVEGWPQPLMETADSELRRSLTIVHVGIVLARALAAGQDADSLEIAAEIRSEIGLLEETPRQVLQTLPQQIVGIRAMLEP
jgi:HD-like signal output (HDOD) protein